MRETLGARPAVGSAGTAAGGLGETSDLEEGTPSGAAAQGDQRHSDRFPPAVPRRVVVTPLRCSCHENTTQRRARLWSPGRREGWNPRLWRGLRDYGISTFLFNRFLLCLFSAWRFTLIWGDDHLRAGSLC